ncbi:MAG: carboxynorspermidine decarboxylase [Lachnospiraceae bacterium]|nr:carboxynorspermidine decarboxylase [Lachnospiraceae bacterium]
MKRSELRTPCYIIQKSGLVDNLRQLKSISDSTGCKILLAQKAFSMYALYPLIGEYLDGTTASGLYEARLGREEMGKENHIFSPAYREEEMEEIAGLCDHIVFNSPTQLAKYKSLVIEKGRSVGLRINPECSTQEEHAIYDPCAPGSRLGVTAGQLLIAEQQTSGELMKGVEGMHFHTLCEQNSDALAVTLHAVEERFAPWLYRMKWINFGGGHHITRADYDKDTLKSCINRIREKYGVSVYLEPGEAVALNSGVLRTTVLEIVQNGINTAVLDASAACHMPDVLEMPYRPPLEGSGMPKEKKYTYRLAGPTCLAGDIIGDYSFDEPLKCGMQLELGDMAIYTMVKNNTFNGMRLPDIVLEDEDGECSVIRTFDYGDFKMRL